MPGRYPLTFGQPALAKRKKGAFLKLGALILFVENVRTSYNAVADEYARRIFSELEGKPLDRELLRRFASSLPPRASVCDLGCGPGQVGKFLHGLNLEVMGIDLSDGMIETARRLTPEIDFRVGDMTQLRIEDESLDGIAAFYSIVNLSREVHPVVFSEAYRVLRPNGKLLISFHIGSEQIHLDDWWERKVSLDFYFFEPSLVAGVLVEAGFCVDEIIERDPYPGVEHPSRRAYLFCTKKS